MKPVGIIIFFFLLLSIYATAQSTYGGFYVYEDYKCSNDPLEVRVYKTNSCIEIDTNGDSSYFQMICDSSNSLLNVYNCTDSKCTSCTSDKFTFGTCSAEDDSLRGFKAVCSDSFPSIGTTEPVQNIFYSSIGCPEGGAYEYVGINTGSCISTGMGFISYTCQSNQTVTINSCSDPECKHCSATSIKDYCTTITGGSAWFGCGKN